MTNENQSLSKEERAGKRLIGWLVSYADDSKGNAYELRVGRALISKEGESDERLMVVKDPSIAAPHAALSGNASHEIYIQDIFTQSGTYVKKGASPLEQKIEGPTKLEHGDWLRFGEKSRYQVCLIQN